MEISGGFLVRHESEVWYIHWTEGRRSKRKSTNTRSESDAQSALKAWREQHGLDPLIDLSERTNFANRNRQRSPIALDLAASADMLRALAAAIPMAEDTLASALRLGLVMMLMDARTEDLCELRLLIGEDSFSSLWEQTADASDRLTAFRPWVDRVTANLSRADIRYSEMADAVR